MSSCLRTYTRTGNGTVNIDCSNADGLLVLMAKGYIISAVLNGVTLTRYGANHAAHMAFPSGDSLVLTLSQESPVYILLIDGGNKLVDAQYSSENTPKWSYLTTIAASEEGGYAAHHTDCDSQYVSNDTTGWTQDYYLDGGDGRNIYRMKRKETPGTSETVAIRNIGDDGRVFKRILVTVAFEQQHIPACSFI